jgi:predicted transcriptional regulator
MNSRYKQYQHAGPGSVCAAALFLFLSQTAAFALQPADTMPPFTVQAENSSFSSRDIAGRVAVISYETKGTAEVNRPFKRAVLQRWRQSDSASPAIVPVINCFSFFGFARSICANRVAAASKKENLVIYTDSDGAMFRDFKMADDQSNIIIFDKKGLVRFAHAGRLDDAGVQAAVKLIERLLIE